MMKPYIKHVLGIFKKLINHKTKNQKLIDLGLILVGNNTEIDSLEIQIERSGGTLPYIVIGDNCLIKGKFIIENKGRIIVGNNSFIGGSTLIANEMIEIGNNVMVSWGCTFFDSDGHSLSWENRKNDLNDWIKGLKDGKPYNYKDYNLLKSKPIKIGDRCWIGFNSVILKGVLLKDEVVVGAGSVVTKGAEFKTLIAGNPARFIKNID